MPTTETLDLSDPATDPEDLFASPSRTTKKKPGQQTRPEPSHLNTSGASSREPPGDADLDSQQAHEAALRQELAGIRRINEVVEGVVNSLEQAKGNMDVGLLVLGSQPQYLILIPNRQYLAPSRMPPPYYIAGPASSRKRNITNASF